MTRKQAQYQYSKRHKCICKIILLFKRKKNQYYISCQPTIFLLAHLHSFQLITVAKFILVHEDMTIKCSHGALRRVINNDYQKGSILTIIDFLICCSLISIQARFFGNAVLLLFSNICQLHSVINRKSIFKKWCFLASPNYPAVFQAAGKGTRHWHVFFFSFSPPSSHFCSFSLPFTTFWCISLSWRMSFSHIS